MAWRRSCGGSADSSGALTLASTWLGNLTNGGHPDVVVIESDGHQDMIYAAGAGAADVCDVHGRPGSDDVRGAPPPRLSRDDRIDSGARTKGELRFAFFAFRAVGASRTIAADAGPPRHRRDRVRKTMAHVRRPGRLRRVRGRGDGQRRADAGHRSRACRAQRRRPFPELRIVRPDRASRSLGRVAAGLRRHRLVPHPFRPRRRRGSRRTARRCTSSVPAATCRSTSTVRWSSAPAGCRNR